VKVAVLGLGFMGAAHVKAWGARLAGVMSSNPAKRSGDLSDVGGNLGLAGERFDFSAIRRFDSVEDALADPTIDAVDICLPTDLHASVAIAALRAGKHVLVEKPMALDAATAQSMCAAAERAGRILMAGHVLRFIPAYQALKDILWGRASALQPGFRPAPRIASAIFRRDCAEPSWSGWLPDRARSGGPALDLLIHDIDYCISLWGMPESVTAIAHTPGELIEARLFYPNLGPVDIAGGWHAEEGYPFSMGFTVTTDAGVCEWTHPAKSLKLNGAEIPLPEEDPFAAELGYFADCVTANRQPDLCPPQQSAQAVALARFILESRNNNGKIVRTV
jgi:predicted dehydrogenase